MNRSITVGALLLGCLLTTSPAHAQGAGMDPTQLIQAPGKLPLGPEAKVGLGMHRTIDAGGQKATERWAIVGETEDAWQVEMQTAAMGFMKQMIPDMDEYMIGATVDKKTGEVKQAVLGKKGEKGKSIQVQDMADGQTPGELPEGEPTEVELGFGDKIKAKKVEVQGSTAWIGTEGEFEGVLLKAEGEGQEGFELAGKPTQEKVQVNGQEVEVTKLSYTNEMKQWLTQQPAVRAFAPTSKEGERGMFKLEAPGITMEVTEVTTEAKPQLTW